MTVQTGRRRLTLLILALLAMLIAACAISPTGRRQLMLYSGAQMDELGVQSFEQIKGGQEISTDAAVNSYVRCVADALIAELDPTERSGWEVVVFADPTANAFALPGRKIGVHTGLLKVAANADQLAAVVGHEIGHVRAGHSNERMSQQQAAQTTMNSVAAMTDPNTKTGQMTMAAFGIGAQYGVLLPFSRAHESEADIMGIDLMARAGFDPSQSVELWRNMAKASGGQSPPEWASTHPSNESRIAELQARVPEAEAVRASARAAGRAPTCTPAGSSAPSKYRKQL